jgi:hypothetical protein
MKEITKGLSTGLSLGKDSAEEAAMPSIKEQVEVVKQSLGAVAARISELGGLIALKWQEIQQETNEARKQKLYLETNLLYYEKDDLVAEERRLRAELLALEGT